LILPIKGWDVIFSYFLGEKSPARVAKVLAAILNPVTDRIGQHIVPLPINHIYNKFRERKRRKCTEEGIDNSFSCKIQKKMLI